MRILVLNPGSSTLKAALVEPGGDGPIDEATIEWPAGDEGASAVLRSGLDQIAGRADAVGYRVVHGGSRYTAPSLVDERLLDMVDALDALAPLHNRRAAAVMRAGLEQVPGVPHVACFDTAFHATLPEEAWRYPLPAAWVEHDGIRRYGFHGLSVAWAVRRAAELLDGETEALCLIVAHLGSGASVTAVDGGRSVATSMGYTPYEGIMMGTRSGSIDPGILLHLAGQGVSVDTLADGLAHESGLFAIGGTSDVRDLEHRADGGDPNARLALTMFARHAAAGIAAASVALPRIDALVFTGGIGEHSAGIRAGVTGRLGALSMPANLEVPASDAVVADGPPAVVVVEAREDLVIAGEVADLLA